MPDLKPCPFCGGKAEWDEKHKTPQCSKCKATIPSAGGIVLQVCKKCGWSHGRVIPYGHFDSNQTTYRVSCPQCSYCTKEKSSRAEAIEAWNRRVSNE